MIEYAEILIEEIKAHGVTTWEIDMQHKHPQLRFEWQGKPLMFVMPKTPSDRHGHLNALTDLRHLMGVRKIIHKSTRPPKRRNKTVTSAPLTLDSFRARANPFAALVTVKDEAVRLISQSAWDGQAAFHAGRSGVAPVFLAPHLAEAFLKGWWSAHRRGV